MRKSSKILAVVLCLVLLTGIIATMISANTEITYPEYTAPEAATVVNAHSADFEEGSTLSSQIVPSNGFVRNFLTANGNRYAQYTNIDADGNLIAHTGRSMGNLGSPYMVMGKYDYITWSFDIMADRYTDGTNIKTAEEYEALADKSGYYPTFATTRFTLEAMGIVGYGDTSFLWIKQDATTKQWYVSTSAAIADETSYPLPTEAGVWTNVTYAICYDANVTYTDANGTKTVSFAQYEALPTEEKAATTNVSVVVNSTLDIYVNGEFAFNIAAAGKNTATYTYDSFTATSNQLKFNQMQFGASGDSRADVPVSYCLDNLTIATYADGYNGDLATALANNTSLLDTNDAIFNQNYNKVNATAATVTTADGTYGYMTVEQAFNAAKNGDTVEILLDNNATLTLDADSEIETLTVKTNGNKFNKALDAKYEAVESNGTYTISIAKYAVPTYVGPVSATIGVNKEFENGTDSITTGQSQFSSTTATMNGNSYAQLSWNGYAGSPVSGEFNPGNLGAGGGYSNNLLISDIFTMEFDIMADKYRNISTNALITIEAYEALSNSDKANYEPAYHGGYMYVEFAGLANSLSYTVMPRIAKKDGVWSFFNTNGVAPLSTKAGVWNHVSFVWNFGNTVTYYTDDTKTATATMSYADYVASGKGADYFVSINTAESTLSVYVDGVFCFGIDNWCKNITDYASIANASAKYPRLRGASSSSSTFSNNFSMGIDNYKTYRYAEGYTGAYATAVANQADFINCADAPFNKDYQLTHKVAGVTDAGAAQGYYRYSTGAVNAVLTEGATIELFADVDVIDLTGLKEVTVISNGNSFAYAGATGVPYELVETATEGTYVIRRLNYKTPEYVGPTGATTLWNTDFQTSSTGSSASGFGTKNGVVNNILTANGNTYAQVTNWVNGAMVENTDRQYGAMHAKYGEVAYGDYFTYSFDIMADKYTNGANLITIAEYEALSDTEKAAYTPSYATTYYYMEAPYLSASIQSPWLKKIDGKWYFCSTSASATNLSEAALLPTEAGVWTNITMAFMIDANVRYTDANGTQTVSYAAYQAISDKSGHTAATVVVNSDLVVYVNGEYAFDYAAFDATNKETDYATAFQKSGNNNRTFRYMQMQGGQWTSSRVTTPMSICYDNLQCVRYPDGYNGSFATAFNNRTALHTADSVFNATYNLTGTYTAAVYNGDNMGTTYYAQESAYALVENGDTIELFANTNAVYAPKVDVTYVKTNGYKFNYVLPEGYTCRETEEEGTYVLKLAGDEDKVEVNWILGGEVYATTEEIIGSTPKAPEYEDERVHPWVIQTVTGWTNAQGTDDLTVVPGTNVFTAEIGYKADVAILTNITTTQAIVTNTYIPALSEEDLALLSNVSFTQSGNERWGTYSQTNAIVNGVPYYKFAETNRIVYNAMDRKAVLSFTYNEVELSVEFICDAYAYFDRILGSEDYSALEKALVYSALDYADAVAQLATTNPTAKFATLVAKYAEYKSTTTSSLEAVIATAVKDVAGMSAVDLYNLSVADGYAARFQFVVNVLPEERLTEDANGDPLLEYDLSKYTLSYMSLKGSTVTLTAQRFDDETMEVNFPYTIAVYDVRQTLTLTIGEETATFNLASYIKDLVDGGYAEDSKEVRVALALYNYSECSEAYKRS